MTYRNFVQLYWKKNLSGILAEGKDQFTGRISHDVTITSSMNCSNYYKSKDELGDAFSW
jgi:hypothetical protein